MKNVFKRAAALVLSLLMLAFCVSCFKENGADNGEGDVGGDAPHTHIYIEGVCECGEKDPNYIPPHIHTPSEAVRENEISATCTSRGSYDSVVYCSGCGEEISRSTHDIGMLEHSYVDGVCACGAKDPTYKPDYGEATVYEAGDSILFISSSYSESTVKMTEELERIVGEGGVIVGSIYNENQKLEILFNIEEEDDSRPAIKAARAYLDALERSSYYNPRYIIYADSGTIAVCFDDVELTNLAVVEYVARIFIEELLSGKDRLVLPRGVVESGTIDLISIQEEIDAENEALDWERFLGGAKQKYGETVGEELYQAFKTYYSMLSEDLYYWYADLYDPGVGGFYASSSGRDSAGFLPLVETSGQIWMQLVSMGLFKETGTSWGKAIPDIIKYQLTYFLKSCQDPNGFFYPPQMEKSALDGHVASRSRNTNRAVSTLASLGSAPTYDTAMGAKGDGITADEFWDNLVREGLVSADTKRPYVPKSYNDYVEHLTASLGESMATAVSGIILTDSTSESMKYLANHANFAAYLNGLNIDGSPYVVGNELNATYTMIAEQARIVGKCEEGGYWYSGMDFKEMLITWLNDHINGKGLFGTYNESSTDPSAGCKYINTNGFFKIMSVYNGYGIAYPEPELAARGCLIGIMSDEVSNGNICETYNIWEGFNLLMINVRTYVEDKELRTSILAEINEAMKDYGPDAVINSYTKQLRYQKADGGFSHNVSKGQTAYQGGVMVGTGVNEANVDACGFGSSSIINAMLDCLGLASYEVQIYRHADYMKFIERLLSREPVVKGVPPGEAYTFDEVPSGDNPQISVADTVKNTASTVTDKGLSASSANKVLKFTKTSTDSGMSLISYSSDEAKDKSCFVYEVDLLYSGVTRKNTTEISIASMSHSGTADKLIYITLDLGGTSNGSAIYYSDGYNGASLGQKIDTGAVVGKWFKLRIEVYSDGTAENFRYKTFINDKLIYVSSSIYGTNILSGKTELYTAEELNRVSHYFCYGFNGEFSFDNLRIYHSDKQNRP